jgi:hypothetical protein
MQYLLLIYQSEAQAAQAGPASQTQMSAEFRTLTQSIIQSGPFAETREQLAGHYLIDAKTLDDAIAIAAARSLGAHRFDRDQAGAGVSIADGQ